MLLIAAILISKLSPRARAFDSDATKCKGCFSGKSSPFWGFPVHQTLPQKGGNLWKILLPKIKQVDLCSSICRSFSGILPGKGFKLRGILQYGTGEEMCVIAGTLLVLFCLSRLSLGSAPLPAAAGMGEGVKKAPECAQELDQQGIKTQLPEHLISLFDHRSWKMNFQGTLGEGRLPSVGSVFCSQAVAASSVPLSSTSP